MSTTFHAHALGEIKTVLGSLINPKLAGQSSSGNKFLVGSVRITACKYKEVKNG